MKVLVTGAGGLVGRAMTKHCTAEGDEVLAFDRRSLDLTDASSVATVLKDSQPDVVINCAAWTDVDACEFDPERAEETNALGPELLATNCRDVDALLITISTDYVFDGSKQGFYTQEDQPNPLSVYGRSKLAGEQRAQSAWQRTIVVRSGYIFGVGGKNFLSTLLLRAGRGESLIAISDMVGTPTYAPHLARRLRELASLNVTGLFHVVNSGDGASFEDFARAALKMARLDPALLQTTTLAGLKRPASRPRNSRLRCLRTEALGLKPLPHWTEALQAFIDVTSGREAAAV